MNPQSVISEINAPILKAGTAITAAVGANTNTVENAAIQVATTLVQTSADPWWFWFVVSIPWGPIASFLAAIYTSMLAGEWLWKKTIRPLLTRWGFMKPPPRRVYTAQEIADAAALLDAEGAQR
ncbi:hypothetical protein [Variovorax sp. DXTD-1]|uniref:hypothetical protein n=1 Tax=Variovorax sp. DXTD-1 TaxID=2495592 RepID=UPI000F865EC3|nr:hypothetical protein [Variovorax sp. DXTD-1]RST54096.1 hypothetical protein EJI00_02925 [Variovorax sp. DXTD-1]